MDTCFTREKVKEILAHKYRVAYDVYEQLALTGKELIHEGDFEANAIIAQRALLRSQYLYGIKASAKALGIGEDEFMEAVNQDPREQIRRDRKEGTECQSC